MAYNKQTWKDEIPDLTKPIKDASGKQKTDPQTGRPLYELVQEGTRITSTRLNHAEQGIEDAHILIEQLAKEWGGSFVASPNGTTGFQFTTSGLTASWTAGVGYVAGRRFDVAAGSLTLNPTQGQYIYLDTDGVVKRTTSQATANAGLLLWYFATDASKVITSTDRRRTITPDTFAKKEDVVLKEPGKGLSTNDYNNTEKAKVQEHGERLQDHDQRLTVIEDEMGEAAPIPATLKPGIQTITADRTTPFNVSGIKGRTLVNLLGRDGNCEDASKWDSWQSVLANDTENFTLGSKSLKITISESNTVGTGGTKQAVPLKAGRYYIIISECKNGNATQVHAYLSGVTSTKSSLMANTTKFTTVYKAYNPTSDTNVTAVGEVRGTGGQYGYIDAIRLYEITATEYTALDSMTPEQIAAKYPYVDDVKPIRNPYAIRYGKNLLPPFTEWSIYDSSITVNSPYFIEINKEKSGVSSSESFAEIKYWAKVQPNTTYTITFNGTANFWVGDNDSNKNRINTPFVGDKPAGVYTFTTKSNTSYLEVVINQNERSAVGSAPYVASNPMLNIGDTALPFEPQNNDYVFYDTVLHSNVDGTVRDELFYRDGQPRKLEKFREVVLDGNLPWEFHSDGETNGYKKVKVKVAKPEKAYSNQYAVKYDGKPLTKNTNTNAPDTFIVFGDDVADSSLVSYAFIQISDADSGWGENYEPSEGEIKAYFYGWKMRGWNGSAWVNYDPNTATTGKYWQPIGAPIDPATQGTVPLFESTVAKDIGKWTPYRLIYQLAQPVEVSVTSEGKITLHEGTNVLEVGTGVVIREATKPFYIANEKLYVISNITDAKSKLKYMSDRIFSVYKNEIRDLTVKRTQAGTPNGKEQATIDEVNYDPNASYFVSYLALDRYAFTAPLINLQGEYAKTVAGVLALEAKNAADVETRVSVANMLLDKILRGEIGVGNDWSKQTFKSFVFNGNFPYGTGTVSIVKVDGRGFIHGFNASIEYSLSSLFLGLYVDGEQWLPIDKATAYSNSSSGGGTRTYPYLIPFKKGFEIKLTPNYPTTNVSYRYAIDGVYSLEN